MSKLPGDKDYHHEGVVKILKNGGDDLVFISEDRREGATASNVRYFNRGTEFVEFASGARSKDPAEAMKRIGS